MALIEPGPFATPLYANERIAAAAARAESPYADLLASDRREAARLGRAHDLTPLVDAIERAATAETPRLRWPVGPTSFSAGRLRPFVPDRLYEWIMRIAFRTRRPLPSDP